MKALVIRRLLTSIFFLARQVDSIQAGLLLFLFISLHTEREDRHQINYILYKSLFYVLENELFIRW